MVVAGISVASHENFYCLPRTMRGKLFADALDVTEKCFRYRSVLLTIGSR